MDIRTRPRHRPNPGQANKSYDVGRYLTVGGPAIRYTRDGKQIKECYPKNIFLPAISRAGNIVNIPLLTNPMNRNFGDAQAIRTKEDREEQGFIWAHECPISARLLHPEDERALFGPDVKGCEDHDFEFEPGKRYKPPNLCPHLVRIRDERKAAHDTNMKAFGGIKKHETQAKMVAALEALAKNAADANPARTRKSRDNG